VPALLWNQPTPDTRVRETVVLENNDATINQLTPRQQKSPGETVGKLIHSPEPCAEGRRSRSA
jgi:hypothetical protein